MTHLSTTFSCALLQFNPMSSESRPNTVIERIMLLDCCMTSEIIDRRPCLYQRCSSCRVERNNYYIFNKHNNNKYFTLSRSTLWPSGIGAGRNGTEQVVSLIPGSVGL